MVGGRIGANSHRNRTFGSQRGGTHNIARGFIRRFTHARRPCPQCGGRGLVEDIEPITATDEAGHPVARQSVWTRCPRCGWRDHSTRDAPRSRSDSGPGGGGFGGGRSSGGGASGRW